MKKKILLLSLVGAFCIVPTASWAFPSFRLEARNLPPAENVELSRVAQKAAEDARADLFWGEPIRDPKYTDIMIVPVYVEAKGVATNAVMVTINYNARKMIALEYGTEDSDFSLFPEISENEPGQIQIAALQPYPGIMGVGKIAELRFLLRGPIEESKLEIIANDSFVYANDGYATDILNRQMNWEIKL